MLSSQGRNRFVREYHPYSFHGGSMLNPRERWSARRKSEVVLRLLRGEELAEMAELLLEEDRGLVGSNLHAGDH
jgi:hypothetical protein